MTRLGLLRIVMWGLVCTACDLDGKSVTATADDDGDSGGEDSAEDDSATGQGPSSNATLDGGEGESDGGTGGSPPIPTCLEEITVMASSAEVSPLGFAADEILAFAQAQHISTFGWSDDTGPIVLESAGPPSQLLITVDYQGHEVRYVESEPNPDNPQEGGFDCNSRVEIDIVLSFATGDGQFAETFPFPSMLTAYEADAAEFRQDIEPLGFSGTFSADQVSFEDDDGEIVGFQINGSITAGDPAETTGGFWIEGTQMPAGFDEGWAFFGTIGSWPAG